MCSWSIGSLRMREKEGDKNLIISHSEENVARSNSKKLVIS